MKQSGSCKCNCHLTSVRLSVQLLLSSDSLILGNTSVPWSSHPATNRRAGKGGHRARIPWVRLPSLLKVTVGQEVGLPTKTEWEAGAGGQAKLSPTAKTTAA